MQPAHWLGKNSSPSRHARSAQFDQFWPADNGFSSHTALEHAPPPKAACTDGIGLWPQTSLLIGDNR